MDYNQNQTYGNGPVYTGEPMNYGSGKGQGKGLGIASMVCGIVSLVACCLYPYVGLVLAVVAIVLGIVQIVKNESKGMAIAGIICGAVTILLFIILLILMAVGVAALGAGGFDMNDIMRELEMY